MPPHASCTSRQSTASTTAEGLFIRNSTARKRKVTALTPPTSTEPCNAKKIKTESTSSTESDSSTGPDSSMKSESSTEHEASRPMVDVIGSVYDAIVTIKVGRKGACYGIHRGLLRRASKFFREELALSDILKSGTVAQVVIMKEDDPGIFGRFKEWLYSSRIISKAETNRHLAWSEIIAVYVFAERRGVPQLQNHCVDTIIRKMKEGGPFPAQADVNTLWKARGNVFRLRRLLLDLFATACNLNTAITATDSYHPKFLEGLVLSLYNMREGRKNLKIVHFWKKRQEYYVDEKEEAPIILD